jgi:hypothetical protein
MCVMYRTGYKCGHETDTTGDTCFRSRFVPAAILALNSLYWQCIRAHLT